MKTILLLVMTIVLGSQSHAAPAADPNASPATQTVLSYLTNLPNRTDHRTITGQWMGWDGLNTAALTRIETIFSNTGQRPGLVGVDAWKLVAVPGQQIYTLTASVPNLIAAWKAGSLIQVDDVHPNPWNGYIASDHTMTTPFANVYTPGNAVNDRFNAQMDQIAAGLQLLENAGVPVLYRPMNEANITGYGWWSGASITAAQFRALWIYQFNYLTVTKGLHNLLWVYAPLDYAPSCVDYYPGSAYVDIVGVSAYNMNGWNGTMHCYASLTSPTIGKPFALAEFGLQDSSNPATPMDLAFAYNNIKTNISKAVYIMHWDANWAINKQLNQSAALNNPWMQNRPVPLGVPIPSSDTIPPVAPTGLMVK